MGLKRFGRGQALGIGGGQIDNQVNYGLVDKIAAANSQPANFDQPGQFERGADHQPSLARREMDAVVADQHRCGDLPGAPGQDEIEGETRFAGP